MAYQEKFGGDFIGGSVEEFELDFAETRGVARSRQEDQMIFGSSSNEITPATFQNAFREIGEEVRNKYQSKLNTFILNRSTLGKKEKQIALDETLQGSTAVVAHYSPSQKLTVANCGDSRAVLFIKKSNNQVDYVRLTSDHKPDSYFERGRLRKMGAEIENGRIKQRLTDRPTTLSMSRSFGDVAYKNNGNYLVSYEPDITECDIKKQVEQYADPGAEFFLVLSCDGLYEQSLNEENYRRALEGWFRNDGQIQEQHLDSEGRPSLSLYIQGYALHNGSQDNVSVCVLNVTRPCETGLMLGVFDGHGGADVSRMLAEKFSERFLSQDQNRFFSSVVFHEKNREAKVGEKRECSDTESDNEEETAPQKRARKEDQSSLAVEAESVAKEDLLDSTEVTESPAKKVARSEVGSVIYAAPLISGPKEQTRQSQRK